MKLFICGYQWIGCYAVNHFHDLGYDIEVFTHNSDYFIPDVQALCKKLNISCHTENINGKEFSVSENDILLSFYYRHIIKNSILEKFNGRSVNLHPSLLPKYGGCSSVTWSIVNGEQKYGYTYHYMREEVDSGNILIQKELDLYPFDLQLNAFQRVMFEAAKDIDQLIELIDKKEEGTPQRGIASYFGRGAPFDGKINSQWTEEEIERFVRAMISPPLPVAKLNDQHIYKLSKYLHD